MRNTCFKFQIGPSYRHRVPYSTGHTESNGEEDCAYEVEARDVDIAIVLFDQAHDFVTFGQQIFITSGKTGSNPSTDDMRTLHFSMYCTKCRSQQSCVAANLLWTR